MTPNYSPRTLREKQTLFWSLLTDLFTWLRDVRGYEMTFGEGRVCQSRTAKTTSGDRVVVTDTVHMSGSLHYLGLAMDLNLFVGGLWVNDGGAPIWTEVGSKWESLHPLCRWGGRFPSVDSNHFSLEHEGRA